MLHKVLLSARYAEIWFELYNARCSLVERHTVQCAGCEIMTGMSVVCPERGGRLYGQGGAGWPRQNKIIIVIVLVFV